MLQSKLLSGDPKLEACAVYDSAHVTPGAVGDHVAKIQAALRMLDGLVIDQSELAGKSYGPSTAAAVLSFKRKRNIINWSYQSQADNIVGKMTIAALDREILLKESQPSSEEDDCYFGPGQVDGRGAAAQVQSLASEAVGAGPQQVLPSDIAKLWAVEVALWVVNVKHHLGWVASILASNDEAQIDQMQTQMAWKALSTHFHIDRSLEVHKTPAQVVKSVSTIFDRIDRVLGRANAFFSDDLNNQSDFAFAGLGGFFAGEQVHFCPRYLRCRPFLQKVVIVHECSHFVDPRIDHLASELPPMDGWPVPGVLPPHRGNKNNKNYSQLSTDEALQNAYSYAQFALHIAVGFDKRLHFKNLTGGNFESE